MNIPESIQERVKKEIDVFLQKPSQGSQTSFMNPCDICLSLGGKNLRPSLTVVDMQNV